MTWMLDTTVVGADQTRVEITSPEGASILAEVMSTIIADSFRVTWWDELSDSLDHIAKLTGGVDQIKAAADIALTGWHDTYPPEVGLSLFITSIEAFKSGFFAGLVLGAQAEPVQEEKEPSWLLRLVSWISTNL